MVQRLNVKNHINARNYSFKSVEVRRHELEKGRQNFAQNSLKVNSPPIIYYQQVKNGWTCTCHATLPPIPAEEQLADSEYRDHRLGDQNVMHEASINLKMPLFGKHDVPTDVFRPETDMFDDEESPNQPLFPDLFTKGTDCGVCYRTGFVPLWHPVGRHRIACTPHNAQILEGYKIERSTTPHPFVRQRNLESFVQFEIEVPLLFRGVFYGVYSNNKRVSSGRIRDLQGAPLLLSHLRAAAGHKLGFRVTNCEFTHVVFEFDLGSRLQANFPQFSVSRDYTYFFNLQSVSIELPATVSNAQVGDIVLVPEWNRLWNVFSVNPFYDQNTLIKTTVEGRLINTIETMANMAKLTELTEQEALIPADEFIPIINKVW